MKKSLIILIMLFLSLTSISFASFTSEWGEYQDNYDNRGFVHDVYSNFNGSYLSSSVTRGTNGYQVLDADLDNDGEKELVIYESGFLYIYNNAFSILAQRIGYLSSPPMLTEVSGTKYILSPEGDSIKVLTYNGTSLNLYNNVSITGGQINGSGMKCDPINPNTCYFFNNTDDPCTFTISGAATCTNIPLNVLSHNDYRRMAMDDIDNDGNMEIAIVANSTKNVIAVVDTSSMQLDTMFSGDGLEFSGGTDNPCAGITTNVKFGDIMFQNAYATIPSESCNIATNGLLTVLLNKFLGLCNPNTGGYKVMFFTSTSYNAIASITSYLCINAVDINGNAFPGFPSYGSEYPSMGTFNENVPLMIASCDFGKTQYDVCGIAQSSRNGVYDGTFIHCVNMNGTTSWDWHATSGNWGGNTFMRSGFVCADMDSDGYDELITTYGIFNRTGSQKYVLGYDSAGSRLDEILTYSPIDSSGAGAIIGTKGSLTTITRQFHSNNPPVLNNSLTYGGYGTTYSIGSPICVNSTLTISAQECGGILSCNYINDVLIDQERLLTNCGQNLQGSPTTSTTDYRSNGTYSLSNPSISCYYNTTGNYQVAVYLQDAANPTDYTQLNTPLIPVQVINGVPGSTCNIGGVVTPGSTTPTSNTTATGGVVSTLDNDANTLFGILFGSKGSIYGFLIAIGIIIGGMVRVYKMGAGNMVTAFTGFLLMIAVTYIGLINAYIFIIFIVVLVLLMILQKTVFTPNSEG